MSGETRQHVVTGATGFVGAALALELLARDEGAQVACLVRGSTPEEADARLRESLALAAHLYGHDYGGAEGLLARSRALMGDITQPRCGVDPEAVGPVAEFWHCAASLDYRESRSDTIFEHNLSGTTNIAKLVGALGSPLLNHFSTAYVAGSRTGLIMEEPATDESIANNAYERSKIATEAMLLESGLTVRILRPSIVVGHSVTMAATGFTGAYSFVRDLRQLRQEVEKRLGGFLTHRPIRARANPDAELNLVPVDLVVRNAVSISELNGPATVYHLTNADAPTVDEAISVVCEEVGIRPFELGASPEDFTTIDEAFDQDDRTEFFRSYIAASRTFDQSNLERVLGGPSGSPLPRERWREFVRWYIDHLDREAEADADEKYGLWQARA